MAKITHGTLTVSLYIAYCIAGYEYDRYVICTIVYYDKLNFLFFYEQL